MFRINNIDIINSYMRVLRASESGTPGWWGGGVNPRSKVVENQGGVKGGGGQPRGQRS